MDTQTIRQKYGSIFEWLDLFDFNIYLIIGIMILVAGINMITALLVLILERTQMIGILNLLTMLMRQKSPYYGSSPIMVVYLDQQVIPSIFN